MTAKENIALLIPVEDSTPTIAVDDSSEFDLYDIIFIVTVEEDIALLISVENSAPTTAVDAALIAAGNASSLLAS